MLQRSPNILHVTRRQVSPRRHHSRPYHRNGQQVAAVRAFTGARLHLGMPIPPLTLSDAACMTGSNVNYVQAAITVLRAEDAALVEAVRTGEIALLAAAAQVRRRADLITALRNASAEDRAAAGRVLGVAAIFDECVVPNLD
jgi:hypothetical protein